MKNILFICSGNTCRSPMAEAICRRLLEREGKSGEALCLSRGLMAAQGAPISENAARALAEIGIDAGSHRAAQLTPELLRQADEIYAMTEGHRAQLARMWPEGAGRIFVLHIADPFGGDIGLYRKCRDQLYDAVKDIVGKV